MFCVVSDILKQHIAGIFGFYFIKVISEKAEEGISIFCMSLTLYLG